MKIPPLIVSGIVVGVSLVSAAPAPKPDDSALLGNIDSLKTAPPVSGRLASAEALKKELATLWDRPSVQEPLNVEIVFSEIKNGYKTEGVYINGFSGAAGQDRIFFYYSRPEKPTGKIPAYIEITGGGGPERGAWFASTNQCAVIDIEWRGAKNKFRSKWAGCNFETMKSLTTSLRDNPAYRLVTGIRRAIDFIETQPDIDTKKIGCGGGSMGGFYTLLSAGVDDRITFGFNELGGGNLADTSSSLGRFELDPERKAIWIKAFDPISYAGRTQAKMFFNLSANDYFFWLGDAVANYQALASEKRICISPNYNHNDGTFAEKKLGAKGWIDYTSGREASYLPTPELHESSGLYNVKTGPEAVGATLYWSPGANLAWPARYWVKVPAQKTSSGWQASVAAPHAGLARVAFMNVQDVKGRTVSSTPLETAGVDPATSAGPLWEGGAIWDKAAGIGAWRQIGPNVRSGSPAKLELKADALLVSPGHAEKPGFSIVTNSVYLASGPAPAARGLVIKLNAGAAAGKLTIPLVRNFGSGTGQVEHVATLDYGAKESTHEIAWNQFSFAKGPAPLFPFDALRIDGSRADGTPLEIQTIALLK
jgi:cephalosporin-C deacetylase-like acetyl esterase